MSVGNDGAHQSMPKSGATFDVFNARRQNPSFLSKPTTDPRLHNGSSVLGRFKKLFRYAFFGACLVVLADQTVICVDKLLRPPIASKVSIKVNETIWYPALTICPDYENRFKESFVKASGVDYVAGSFSTKLNHWKNYHWGQLSLQDFWANGTWGPEDVIDSIRFALSFLRKEEGFVSNRDAPVVLERHFYWGRGQCVTARPTRAVTPDPGNGYYVNLQLDHKYDDSPDMDEFNWHLYLTVPGEPYLDFGMFKSLDMISVSPGTRIAAAIGVRVYQAKSTEEWPCNDDIDYQMPMCGISCLWNVLLEENPMRKCRMPWMELDAPLCKSYEEVEPILKLVTNDSFGRMIKSRCKHCIRSCRNIRYEPNVLTRTQLDPKRKGAAEVNMYFATNELLYIDEMEGYDFTNFLGEMGGTLGLLTGFSLLSILTLIELSCAFFGFVAQKHIIPALRKCCSQGQGQDVHGVNMVGTSHPGDNQHSTLAHAKVGDDCRMTARDIQKGNPPAVAWSFSKY